MARKLHTLVTVGDIKILGTIIGRMGNTVAAEIEQSNTPQTRPQLSAGDAQSKVNMLRHLCEELTYIADAIEDNIQEQNA